MRDGEFHGTERFEVRRLLGAGGMGVVYEVNDRARNARVALKTVRGLGPEALLRLKNEFRALHDLGHPNLVRLHELVEDHGHWFFTMELVEGEDFFSWVRPAPPGEPRERSSPDSTPIDFLPAGEPAADGRASDNRPLDEARLRAVLPAVVRGVIALHAAGRLHRDLKPSNVLVTPTGRPVILDLGLVTRLHDGLQSLASLDGIPVGTIAYMAPEQAAGEQVGPPADWYASASCSTRV